MIDLSTEIAQNMDVILRYLYEKDIESQGEASINGDAICQGTNLKPSQINEAVKLLHSKGFVEWFTALGTAPYHFYSVKITPDGKQHIQRKDLPRKIEESGKDPRSVFVVHGRNLAARNAIFTFLRAIGLHPLEWSQLVAATGKGSPYIGEILDEAFSKAQAVVVLMTPDDEGYLRQAFRSPGDPPHETKLTPQARLNVLFEAGMAMGRSPERTILVELGRDLRPFSDIAGRHVVRLDNTSQRRQELAQRLENTGCAIDLSGTDWYQAGDFTINGEETEAKIEDPTRSPTYEWAQKRDLVRFIYGPLYNEINSFLNRQKYKQFRIVHYENIIKDYAYLLNIVDQDLVEDIERFYSTVQKLNKCIEDAPRIIQRIVNEVASNLFVLKNQHRPVTIHVNIAADLVKVLPTIDIFVLKKMTPSEWMKVQYPNARILNVTYEMLAGENKRLLDEERYTAILESSRKKAGKNEVVGFIWKKEEELEDWATVLWGRLRDLIQG